MRKGTHPRTALGQTAAQMIRRYYLHDVARDSAALTYYLLFAIFPLLIFVSTLLGILELDVDSIVTGLRQIVPGDVAEVVRGYLEYVSGNASRQLMWFSLVFSIWFPMRATGCLLHSLRKAFGKGQPKNILLDQLKIFLFAIWLMVSIGLTLLMITVGRRALYFVSGIITVPDGFINLWSKLRFVAVALLMFVLVTVLYMLALGRRCPLREVAPGVAVSLAAWMLLSLAFSYYVENLAHYTQLYGSIATIVVVLLWLYMSGTVLIMGGDCLLGLMRQLDVTEIMPLCEVAPGVVLSQFTYGGRQWNLVSKSGGFGAKTLFYDLQNILERWKKELPAV